MIMTFSACVRRATPRTCAYLHTSHSRKTVRTHLVGVLAPPLDNLFPIQYKIQKKILAVLPNLRRMHTRGGTLWEHPQVAAQAVRQARLQRPLHSVPLGETLSKIGRARDRTSKGRDRGRERRRKGGWTERASGASGQAERLREERSGESQEVFFVKHISYHPNR